MTLKAKVNYPFVLMLNGLILISITSLVMAADREVAGYVTDIYQSGNSEINIYSEGIAKPASILMKVYKGDVVTVPVDSASIRVKLAKENITIDASNSPYTIKDVHVESSVFSKVLSWAENIVEDSKDSSRTVYAASRGGQNRLKLKYASSKENILSVSRTLVLELLHGKAPYRIHIASTDGQVIANRRDFADKLMRFNDIPLFVGDFNIVVCDVYDCFSYPIKVSMGNEKSDHIMVSEKIIEALAWINDGDSSKYLQAFQILELNRGLSPLVDEFLNNYSAIH